MAVESTTVDAAGEITAAVDVADESTAAVGLSVEGIGCRAHRFHVDTAVKNHYCD